MTAARRSILPAGIKLLIGTATLGGYAWLSGCATAESLREPCDMDAATRQQVMENIAVRLAEMPEVKVQQYLADPFEPAIVYNGKDSCTFVISPVQPVDSELIWDGRLGFKVNKQSLKIEDVSNVD